VSGTVLSQRQKKGKCANSVKTKGGRGGEIQCWGGRGLIMGKRRDRKLKWGKTKVKGRRC